jgi:hypothetical protein
LQAANRAANSTAEKPDWFAAKQKRPAIAAGRTLAGFGRKCAGEGCAALALFFQAVDG